MSGTSLPSPEGSPDGGLARLSSGEPAAGRVRERIFDGQLPRHSRIPQDEIAESLGISRIPLREALIALEREGWVTIEIHRGAFVNAFTVETVEDHFALFAIIYSFAIHQALQRGGPEFVEQMEALQAKLAATTDPAEAAVLIFSIY